MSDRDMDTSYSYSYAEAVNALLVDIPDPDEQIGSASADLPAQARAGETAADSGAGPANQALTAVVAQSFAFWGVMFETAATIAGEAAKTVGQSTPEPVSRPLSRPTPSPAPRRQRSWYRKPVESPFESMMKFWGEVPGFAGAKAQAAAPSPFEPFWQASVWASFWAPYLQTGNNAGAGLFSPVPMQPWAAMQTWTALADLNPFIPANPYTRMINAWSWLGKPIKTT